MEKTSRVAWHEVSHWYVAQILGATDDSGRRAIVAVARKDIMSGPLFSAADAPQEYERSVSFRVPDYHADKSNLGTKKRPGTYRGNRDVVHSDDQYCFQVNMSFVAARQKAL